MFKVRMVLVCVSKGFPPDNSAQHCRLGRSPRSAAEDSGPGPAWLLGGAVGFFKATGVSLMQVDNVCLTTQSFPNVLPLPSGPTV